LQILIKFTEFFSYGFVITPRLQVAYQSSFMVRFQTRSYLKLTISQSVELLPQEDGGHLRQLGMVVFRKFAKLALSNLT